jgi:hypothetical protein
MTDNDDIRRLGDFASLPDAAIDADKEFLAELAPWVSNGRISVEKGSESYFSLIESKYPIGVNRIDWSRIRNSLFHEVVPFDLPSYSLEYRLDKLTHLRPVLLDWFLKNAIRLDKDVIVVGDNSNVALHMSLNTVLDCYKVLFTSSQHMYVLPPTGDWCLHYTLEDTLNFGWAPT